MRQFVLGLATLALATSAHAGDLYNSKILGFSADNKLVAIAETVVQDGSGHGVAKISVLNVAKNSLVLSAFGRDESDVDGSEKKALSIALAKINLSKLGITAGKNLGRTLIDRLPTDHSSTSNTIFSLDAWAQGGASAMLPQYSLEIQSSPAKAECYGEGDAQAMKLTLKAASESATQVTKVLQQDSSTLPKSRGCATNYRVTKVVRSGSALLVLVEYMTPGFEGPNFEHIGVTAELQLN